MFTGLTEGIFQFVNEPYDLRNNRTESFSSLSSKMLELMPQSLKDETELSQFKTKIKTWTTNQCPHRLRKKYVVHT